MQKKEVYVGFATVLLLVVLVLVSAFWVVGNIKKSAPISVGNGYVKIGGYYHKNISLTNANALMQKEVIETDSKMSGTSMQTIKKGRFKLANKDETVYLNLMNVNKAYVYIISNNEKFFLNCNSEAETEKLFTSITTEINKLKAFSIGA